MPDYTKIFTYEVEGLSYTVGLYQDPDTGDFLADISVLEGGMDVNAIYFGDDDFSGGSESLGGPLNMNGARLDGDQLQWDGATALSRPGLGRDGTDKETYVAEGDTLTVELDIDSLDEIDVFGIRATSTTTPEGSIKAVSDDPEEPEEPEEPEDPTFDKIGFGVEIGDNGGIENGIFLMADDLPDGEEASFESYVDFYDSTFGDDPDYNVTQVESVIFYELLPGTDENGDPIEIPQELFRIDAPEGGFQDADAMLAAYDDAIADGALDGAQSGAEAGLELMAALSLDDDFAPDSSAQDDSMVEDDMEMA
ncbi:hypothetical protein [Alterinioella nitratireducens]|uniref:hypothetical protein n=1 Tax=Alterinioella nitratireducens TaxID=2735915 RepID=UPI00405A00CF